MRAIPPLLHSAALELIFNKRGSSSAYVFRNDAAEHFVWPFAWKSSMTKMYQQKSGVHESCSRDRVCMRNHKSCASGPWAIGWSLPKKHCSVLHLEEYNETHSKYYACTRHTLYRRSSAVGYTASSTLNTVRHVRFCQYHCPLASGTWACDGFVPCYSKCPSRVYQITACIMDLMLHLSPIIWERHSCDMHPRRSVQSNGLEHTFGFIGYPSADCDQCHGALSMMMVLKGDCAVEGGNGCKRQCCSHWGIFNEILYKFSWADRHHL